MEQSSSVAVDADIYNGDLNNRGAAPFIGSGDYTGKSFFTESVLNRGRTHETVTGVPYCTSCKSYLETALLPRTHELTGYLGKRKPGFFSFRVYRWFLLAEDHLMYYINENDVGITFPNGTIHLDGCIVEDPEPKRNHFFIRRGGSKIEISASTFEDKLKWLIAIRRHDHTHDPELLNGKVNNAHLWFCDDCSKYVDLDAFTLADQVGSLQYHDGNSWETKWVSLSGNHIAVYENSKVFWSIRITYNIGSSDIPT